ncbi:MAG: hypothetical protein ACLGJC_17405 [Alphaproteobacteria bacterium]
MADDPAAELARADQMERQAEAFEAQAKTLRRQARQTRAKHANWRDPALIEALNKAIGGSNGNDT